MSFPKIQVEGFFKFLATGQAAEFEENFLLTTLQTPRTPVSDTQPFGPTFNIIDS